MSMHSSKETYPMSKSSLNWMICFYVFYWLPIIVGACALPILIMSGYPPQFKWGVGGGLVSLLLLFLQYTAITYYTAYEDRSVKFLSFQLYILTPLLLIMEAPILWKHPSVLLIWAYWWMSFYLLRRENVNMRRKPIESSL